ncbi:GAF and ANTAR domain-containing protein [Arthrobacter sp. ERGS1:01]|uniref:GAF and ANTAR domain-containing protein n=1 Tax=Arthrobacter sp. ERGS1:01 TaxID=1704044 RepID=UPI000A60AA5E|nr:GAF and ANTAR domain-containing protein [Arthrobacter sp. ERGS1:01]
MTTPTIDQTHPNNTPAPCKTAKEQSPPGPGLTVAEHLQELVIDSTDLTEFLLLLCDYSATLATAEDQPAAVECAVMLYQRHRTLAGTGNTARAQLLNELLDNTEQNPSLAALKQERTIVIHEALTDQRWPLYSQGLIDRGVNSVLAVPLILGDGAAASISFYSTVPHAFDDDMAASAKKYARQAQGALRLAVRIGVKQQKAEDLQNAMNARTVVDLAIGVIMGQQHCPQDTALELLCKAATSRNENIRIIAEEIVNWLTKTNVTTHFDS